MKGRGGLLERKRRVEKGVLVEKRILLLALKMYW